MPLAPQARWYVDHWSTLIAATARHEAYQLRMAIEGVDPSAQSMIQRGSDLHPYRNTLKRHPGSLGGIVISPVAVKANTTGSPVPAPLRMRLNFPLGACTAETPDDISADRLADGDEPIPHAEEVPAAAARFRFGLGDVLWLSLDFGHPETARRINEPATELQSPLLMTNLLATQPYSSDVLPGAPSSGSASSASLLSSQLFPTFRRLAAMPFLANHAWCTSSDLAPGVSPKLFSGLGRPKSGSTSMRAPLPSLLAPLECVVEGCTGSSVTVSVMMPPCVALSWFPSHDPDLGGYDPGPPEYCGTALHPFVSALGLPARGHAALRWRVDVAPPTLFSERAMTGVHAFARSGSAISKVVCQMRHLHLFKPLPANITRTDTEALLRLVKDARSVAELAPLTDPAALQTALPDQASSPLEAALFHRLNELTFSPQTYMSSGHTADDAISSVSALQRALSAPGASAKMAEAATLLADFVRASAQAPPLSAQGEPTLSRVEILDLLLAKVRPVVAPRAAAGPGAGAGGLQSTTFPSEVDSMFRPQDNFAPLPQGELQRASVVLEMALALDDSQRRAIVDVLSRTLSVIQGPPGTGKTQTIAHLAWLWAAGLGPPATEVAQEPDSTRFQRLPHGKRMFGGRGRIFVTAFSNTALNVIAERIITLPGCGKGGYVKIVRIGKVPEGSKIEHLSVAQCARERLLLSHPSVVNRADESLARVRSIRSVMAAIEAPELEVRRRFAPALCQALTALKSALKDSSFTAAIADAGALQRFRVQVATAETQACGLSSSVPDTETALNLLGAVNAALAAAVGVLPHEKSSLRLDDVLARARLSNNDSELRDILRRKFSGFHNTHHRANETASLFAVFWSWFVPVAVSAATEINDALLSVGCVPLTAKVGLDGLHSALSALQQQLEGAKRTLVVAQSNYDGRLRDGQQAVVDEADIVLATCVGAGQRLVTNSPRDFSLIIVDEASQAPESSVVIPLAMAARDARAVLVGDQCQLPPTSRSRRLHIAGATGSLFERLLAPSETPPIQLTHALAPQATCADAAQRAWLTHGSAFCTSISQWLTWSLDELRICDTLFALTCARAELLSRSFTNTIAPSVLRVQYRMHAAVSAWPSRQLYDGRVVDGVTPHARRPPPGFPWLLMTRSEKKLALDVASDARADTGIIGAAFHDMFRGDAYAKREAVPFVATLCASLKQNELNVISTPCREGIFLHDGDDGFGASAFTDAHSLAPIVFLDVRNSESATRSPSNAEEACLVGAIVASLMNARPRPHTSHVAARSSGFFARDGDKHTEPWAPIAGGGLARQAVRMACASLQGASSVRRRGSTQAASTAPPAPKIDAASPTPALDARLLPLIGPTVSADDIGVVCPYMGQVRLIKSVLQLMEEDMDKQAELSPRGRASSIEVQTVDGFQGREKEVIILSCVRSNARGSLGFVQDVRRLNVAATRAKRGLIVIGNAALLSRHATWCSYLSYLSARGLLIDAREVLLHFHGPGSELPPVRFLGSPCPVIPVRPTQVQPARPKPAQVPLARPKPVQVQPTRSKPAPPLLAFPLDAPKAARTQAASAEAPRAAAGRASVRVAASASDASTTRAASTKSSHKSATELAMLATSLIISGLLLVLEGLLFAMRAPRGASRQPADVPGYDGDEPERGRAADRDQPATAQAPSAPHAAVTVKAATVDARHRDVKAEAGQPAPLLSAPVDVQHAPTQLARKEPAAPLAMAPFVRDSLPAPLAPALPDAVAVKTQIAATPPVTHYTVARPTAVQPTHLAQQSFQPTYYVQTAVAEEQVLVRRSPKQQLFERHPFAHGESEAHGVSATDISCDIVPRYSGDDAACYAQSARARARKGWCDGLSVSGPALVVCFFLVAVLVWAERAEF